MARGEGKKPDWNVSAMDATNICKGKVGAAWNNDDGTISIKLNSFVVLEAIHDLRIKLFPNTGYEDRQKGKVPTEEPPPLGEDDIPF